MTKGTFKGLIADSLALAGERCADMTPLVYNRLFDLRPETRSLFRDDPRNLIKGSMLELAIDAILDFVGERKAAHRLIICEVQSHDGYGTTPELFIVFFVVIADTVRDILGVDWSQDHQNAWDDLVDQLNNYVARGVRAMA
jgi:hemoglobin-like flavoprotein